MAYTTLRKLCCMALLLLCTACPVPDVDEYSELTREMTEALKTSADEVVDFLDEGLSFPEDDTTGMDPLLLEDLAGLHGKEHILKPADYPKQLRRNWHTIFKTLDALVAYSDALAGIKDSGAKGKAAFGNVANALNNVLAVSGIAIPGAVSKAGGYLYGKIAQIRAKKKLQDVITNADEVIQHVALTLDSALYYMEAVNDAAKSENLLRKSDSEEAQQIKELYTSLVEKEKRNRVKIILLNDYENGDYESLRFFVYEDPLSLDKLGIKDLTDAISNINATDGLSPQERLEKIAALARKTFRTA
ncbi:MAG: hypothetical protein KDD04_06725, partial [Sinomicrobium sp.]|nr:hypothetical protein [Sinomicrobium sp.]